MEKETDEITVKIATELRVARERMNGHRPTNAEIAATAGISAMAAGRYLSGERAIPMPTFVRMCNALKVDPGSILDAAVK